jgi:protein-tyrosine phosphatase
VIDLHTHILPAVDDGPRHLSEALVILENGVRNGVATFVLTPHVKTEADWKRLDAVREAFHEFREDAAVRATGAELLLGAEVLLTPWLPETLEACPSLTINGGRHLLVELPQQQLPIYADDVLCRLLMKNVVPVLAHPERYLFLEDASEHLATWIANGVLMQVNSGSLTGKFGSAVKRKAQRLLKNGQVHLLGSDVHSSNERYDLREGRQLAAALLGAAAGRTFEDYAAAVLGRGLPVPCRDVAW